MPQADIRKYEEMFEYLREPFEPPIVAERANAAETIVFGRHDALLAETMGRLYISHQAGSFTVSGGFGKDSRELWDSRVPEARFVRETALAGSYGIRSYAIDCEYKALTGDDNARFSLRLLRDQRRSVRQVTAIAHATSLKRLAATLTHEAARLNLSTQTVYRVPTDYPFNAEDTRDQKEAAEELLRLAYWPTKKWLEPQPDLPENLVDFAHSVAPEIPGRPSGLQKAILRALPHSVRRRVMEAV